MVDVSIIIPCLNEEQTISLLLEAIHGQTYPQHEIEVIIADGISNDRTREVIKIFQLEHPGLKIKVVDNLKRSIPSGLNRAFEAASGEFIVRLDAHSIPAADYVALSIQALKGGSGEVVGGVWEIKPGGGKWISQAIAAAACHPLGAGDARYRVGGEAQIVDTVPFGAYHRRLFLKIGGYDETLLSNEDYEFNVRTRQAGGKIWMDPQISSIYFARGSLGDLAKQYWRYGYWKLRMLLRYPGTFRWRQIAGVFVLSWPVLGLISIWLPPARWLLLLETVLYISALVLAGIQCVLKRQDIGQLFGVPLAIATMHFSWGTGFLWSAVEYYTITRKKSKLAAGG
jgi:glycosyltransferase involved in cell wall biosynthesis